MKLCIAEKPSVAGDIAKILGARDKKDGYYEGNGYWVSWTFGHLCTLYEPHEYDEKYKKWNTSTLPILPDKHQIKLIPNDGVKRQFSVIKRLVAACEEVINCGDAGQEGELIQRWVLELAENAKPLKRLWISSLTEEAIKKGFEKLEDGNKYNPLFMAGKARAVGDWLLGMNATRMYTLKFGTQKQVLSIGRVQTPTLALIVERQNLIDSFDSVTFFEVNTLYRATSFSLYGEDEEGKIKKQLIDSEEKAIKLCEQLNQHELEVSNVKKKKGKELHPKLFDLTSLQVECNKKLNLSAEETLNIAQGLYEKKVLTYPRVDSSYLSDDVYKEVGGILNGLYKDYKTLIDPIKAEGAKLRKSKKAFDNKKVSDHHAIIPTGQTMYLSGNDKAVYEMVLKRFLSIFYPDCETQTMEIEANVSDSLFKTSNKIIIKPGWKALYTKDEKNKDDDDDDQDEEGKADFPTFKKGEKGPHECSFQEKNTSPPKLYTEATLLRAMETAGKNVDDEELRDLMKANGIGRPSTRANIIETLIKRKYVEKKKKNLVPTHIGNALIKSIKQDLLKSAELTGLWEKKLKDIEAGNYDPTQFLKEMEEMVAAMVDEMNRVQTNKHIGGAPPEAQEKKLFCPKCKTGRILKGKKAFGCSNYSRGCKWLIPFDYKGLKINDAAITQLLAHNKYHDSIIGVKIDPFGNLTRVVLVKEGQECPKCKKGKILKGKTAYGCSHYKEGCKFKVDF